MSWDGVTPLRVVFLVLFPSYPLKNNICLVELKSDCSASWADYDTVTQRGQFMDHGSQPLLWLLIAVGLGVSLLSALEKKVQWVAAKEPDSGRGARHAPFPKKDLEEEYGEYSKFFE